MWVLLGKVSKSGRLNNLCGLYLLQHAILDFVNLKNLILFKSFGCWQVQMALFRYFHEQ